MTALVRYAVSEETFIMENWPICKNPHCDNEVNPKRVAIGHPTCLECGSPNARVYIIDVPKSNPIVTTDLNYAKGIGSSHKGNRQCL